MKSRVLPPPVRAFDRVAPAFDERYGAWRSVHAQRDAVRRLLLATFARGARLLELGGGTGEDAAWLAGHGRAVLLTDGSPAMLDVAACKLRALDAPVAVELAPLLLEDVDGWAEERQAASFDGAYSNFAALNCVRDLAPVARGLGRLVRPGGAAVLVLFGPLPPGEVLVELLRGRAGSAFRRLERGDVHARLGGEAFTVRYPRRPEVTEAFAPWFRLERARGIGVFVPPSAAEPWISAHPRLLGVLAGLDRLASGALSFLGDHVAYVLRRTAVPTAGGGRGDRP